MGRPPEHPQLLGGGRGCRPTAARRLHAAQAWLRIGAHTWLGQLALVERTQNSGDGAQAKRSAEGLVGAGDAGHVAAGDVAAGPYAQERAFLSLETSDVMNTLGPFLGDIIARNARAGGETRGLGGSFRGQSPGASVAEALRRRARDIEEAEQRDQSLRHARHDHRHVGVPASGKYDAARSRLRVHSAPEPSAGPTLSRMFENTETHLPAAAVRRTAERQEMQQLRNAHQTHQAYQARGSRDRSGRERSDSSEDLSGDDDLSEDSFDSRYRERDDSGREHTSNKHYHTSHNHASTPQAHPQQTHRHDAPSV